VVSLPVVYVLTSVAVLTYFRRDPLQAGLWQTKIAPAVSGVLLLRMLCLVITNFNQLIGGDEGLAIIILAIVPACFVSGIAVENHQLRRVVSVA
jgi:hypothetical protein